MDFDLTEEQRLLRESVERLLADHYGFDKRRAYLAEPDGWSRALWARYAELGLLGLPFAENYSGFGGGPIEVMLVMEAFGRVLALEPYLATVVLGGTALRLAGNETQKSAILPQIAEGDMILTFAHGERQARYDLTDVLTTAKPKGAGWVLDGAKSVVLHGDSAQRLVVSARTAGDRHDPAAVDAADVAARHPGVHARDLDARHLLGLGDGGLDRLDRRVDVDDDPPSEPAGGRGSDPDDVQDAPGRGLGDDRADLRGADVQADREVRRLRASHRAPSRWKTT